SVAPAGIRRGSTYFPELESLRGLAILLVFVFHADGVLLAPFRSHVGAQSPVPLAFVWAGHSGVTLFFVLSAFLLSLPFLDEANGGRTGSRPPFYQRRALRTLPLYLAGGVVGASLPSPSPPALPRGAPPPASLPFPSRCRRSATSGGAWPRRCSSTPCSRCSPWRSDARAGSPSHSSRSTRWRMPRWRSSFRCRRSSPGFAPRASSVAARSFSSASW